MRSFKKLAAAKQGLTLIELIVSMAILGIITASIGYFFTDSQFELAASERKIAAQNELNNAMRDILENLKKVGQEKVDSTFETIEIKDVVNKDFIILRNSSDEIIYGIINKTLYRAVNVNVNPSVNRRDKESLDVFLTSSVDKTAILNYVEEFSVEKDGKKYEIRISVNPDDIGKKVIDKITLTSKFTPRFDMSIR